MRRVLRDAAALVLHGARLYCCTLHADLAYAAVRVEQHCADGKAERARARARDDRLKLACKEGCRTGDRPDRDPLQIASCFSAPSGRDSPLSTRRLTLCHAAGGCQALRRCCCMLHVVLSLPDPMPERGSQAPAYMQRVVSHVWHGVGCDWHASGAVSV